MKLYICGAVSCDPTYKEVFADAERKLVEVGYEVINPTTIAYKDENDWNFCMRENVAAMLTSANAVCLLRGWAISKGVFIVCNIAQQLEIPIATLMWWLRAKNNNEGEEK